MNLLILSLLFAVVFSRVIYPEDVDDSSRECTVPCFPDEICENGRCVEMDMFADFTSDCPYKCPRGMKCRNGKCPVIINRHQFNRRSFRAGCAAPCGPGTTCMMGNCVQDAG
ncbi:hypothetical protein CAEBREN_13041 [Caenorhabditis brenneri]|uniref:TIL domain-containing protein n=1 Tax=Caenorhabditis brenneri TaxID=135651 RepID=G0NZI7_CAEBE|nr:hypothetical protein CAEBREN_13041 [Caenorhabditis brenneri]